MGAAMYANAQAAGDTGSADSDTDTASSSDDDVVDAEIVDDEPRSTDGKAEGDAK